MFKKAAMLAIGLAVALKGVKIRFNRAIATGDWWTRALI
jgi:hypothetical protein